MALRSAWILLLLAGPLSHVRAFKYDDFNIQRLFENSDEIFGKLQTNHNSRICVNEFREFVDDVKKGFFWANRVIDTWAKEPPGIYSDVTRDFGHFQQCVKGDSLARHEMQHCRVGVETARNFSYHMGVCVPKTCSPDMAQEILTPFLKNADLTTTSVDNCSEGGAPAFGYLQWLTLVGLLIPMLLVLLGTWRDYRGQKGLLTSFSLIYNTPRLFEQKENSGQMACLNGIRVLSMLQVVNVHAYEVWSFFTDVINPQDLRQFERSYMRVLMAGAEVAVDTFLVISALLITYSFLRARERKEKFNFFKYLLHRYVRLMPVFIVVMMIWLAFGRHFDNGPRYEELTGAVLVDNCRDYWWSALLLVQTYVNPHHVCVETAWYLSLDFHLVFITPFVLFPLVKFGWKKVTPVLVLLSLGSVASMIWGSLEYKFTFLYMPDPFRGVVYFPTHAKVGQWFLGIMCGYYLYHTRNQELKLSRTTSFLLWCGSILAIVGMTVAAWTQFHYESDNVTFFAIFYSLYHQVWCLALVWIIIGCVKGYGGWLNTFLSRPEWQPWAKLSYGIFLIHWPINLQTAAMQRTLLYFSRYTMWMMYFGITALSAALAVPMYLIYEITFANFETGLLKKLGSKPKNADVKPENVSLEKQAPQQLENTGEKEPVQEQENGGSVRPT